MTRALFISATALGGAAIIWMAAGFLGSSTLAFLVTAVIGVLFGIGIAELLQFRSATATLDSSLASASAETGLPQWIAGLHPSLRNAVRLRIEGEPVALPGPVFTPYLVGLLIMLGLLGTFLGMVDTLQGAVIALEGSTELETIRNGMAAPIQGLGVAFGTSVAGVAASAMLGLNATLCRRERMLVTRGLDDTIATDFYRFSLSHNRNNAFQAMQSQAEALPAVVEQLNSLAGRLDQMGSSVGEQLLEQQDRFNESVAVLYKDLAQSVERSLSDALEQGGQMATEHISTTVAGTMANIRANADASAAQLQTELAALREQEEKRRAAVLERDKQLLAEHRERVEKLDKLAGSVEKTLAASASSQREGLDQMLAGSADALTRVSDEFAGHINAQATRLTELTSDMAVSSTEMASMGEAFKEAVSLFSESNRDLVGKLENIQQALEAAGSRSDEQLAYYVAQAREIIDQSMLSQQSIIEEMRQFNPAGTPVSAAVG